MNPNKHFDLRNSKIQAEAILKSALVGLSIGLALDFVLGMILWFIGFGTLVAVIGILAGVLVGVTLISGAIFYLTLFHPTEKSNARRMDKLGLEERVVTMLELENDDSYMAVLQREDAKAALARVQSGDISFQFKTSMIVTFAVCAFLGFGMSIISILSAAGLLPFGKDFIDSLTPEPPPVYIPISYIAEDGGYIDGEEEQLILMGGNAETVVAVPEEGYSFEGWDDGGKKPSRTDKEIDHPLVLTAIFLPLEDEGEDEGDEGESGENGEEAGEQEGDSGESSDQNQPGDKPSDTGGGGKYNKENQIIDGETYYREYLEYYKEEIMRLLEKRAEELTEEEKALIEAYINIV